MKILHVLSRLDCGGVENMLYNYYSWMDRENIIFDFVVNTNSIGALEEKFKALGSNIFHVTGSRESIKSHVIQLSEILKSNTYDIIHFHQGYLSLFDEKCAKKYGYKNLFLHSHSANEPIMGIKSLLKPLLTFMSNRMATTWCACGYSAGIFQYGKSAMEKGKVQIINNAIDIQKYKFNSEERIRLRKELGLEDKYVIGNIGRLTYQKNQGFLIDVFKEVHEKNPKTVLLIVGDGEDKEKIQNQITKLGLTECVYLLGKRNDVNLLYNAFDIFVLPSRYEGFPVVGIEAQSNGCPSLFSNTIDKFISVNENCERLSIKNKRIWVNMILEYNLKFKQHYVNQEKIRDEGYDINIQANKLKHLYLMTLEK